MFDMFAGDASPDDHFRAQYHALYLGLDHHAVDDRGFPSLEA